MEYVARLPADHHRRIGTSKGSGHWALAARPSSRCAGSMSAAVGHGLARDAGVSQATGYRYLHKVLDRCQQEGKTA